MTSKKDPPKWTQKKPKTPDKPAEPATPAEPIEVASETVVRAIGALKGASSSDIGKAVDVARKEMQGLVSSIEAKGGDPKAAAQDVQKLMALLAQIGGSIGAALANVQAPVGQAIKGADVKKAGEALELLGEWLKNPTPEGEAKAKAAVGALEQQFGPMVGKDKATEEAERKAEIKAVVQKSLDEIFAPKKK